MKNVNVMKNLMTMQNSMVFRLTAAGVLSLAISSAVQAADAGPANGSGTSSSGYAMEEVTVTAQRRDEQAVDVPISITALSADQLGQGDVQTLGDIMKLTPGVRFDEIGGNSQPTIRGVGTAVVVAGASSNVSLYSDGFYSPNMLMGDTELLNIESIQVLKGPQGTLFGRNSTGGAILVTTADPEVDPHGRIEASFGSYNTQRYQVYATGGVSEALAFDVSALLRRGDGYVDNIYTGSDKDGDYDHRALRLGAKWFISDDTSLLFRYSHTEQDDPSAVRLGLYKENGQAVSTAATFGATVATEPHDASYNFKPEFESEADVYQLTFKTSLDFADLTSYTQYRDEFAAHAYDFDSSSLSIYHYTFETTDKIFSQEFLLASNTDSALQWTTGLFYFQDETEYPNNRASVAGAPFTAFGGSGATASSLAVYADATYELTDDLFLTLGARYSQEKIEDAYFIYDNTGEKYDVNDSDDDSVTPRIALRYELDDNASVYVSYTKGFKAGVVNVAGGTSAVNNGNLNSIYVDPEEIKAWEAGYKYSGDRLMLDAAVFKYDYQDLQVASYAQSDSILRNAAESSIKGVDLQVRFAVTDELQVNFATTYLDAKYDDFQQSQEWNQCLDATACGSFFGVYVPSYGNASGNHMLRSPEWTATLGANYQTGLESGATLDVSGNLYYTSDFFFDSSELYEQKGYHLLSLRAQWTDPTDTYSVAVYGDNLTDEDYYTQVLPQFYGPLVTWGAPRTVGVSVGMNF